MAASDVRRTRGLIAPGIITCLFLFLFLIFSASDVRRTRGLIAPGMVHGPWNYHLFETCLYVCEWVWRKREGGRRGKTERAGVSARVRPTDRPTQRPIERARERERERERGERQKARAREREGERPSHGCSQNIIKKIN